MTFSGCEKPVSAPQIETEQAAPTPLKRDTSVRLASDKAGDSQLPEKELEISQLQGSWRVVAVARANDTRLMESKQSIVGAIADIYPEHMRWTYTPAPSVKEMKDLCAGPIAGIVTQPAAKAEIKVQFAQAIRQFKLEPEKISQPHEWRCADGGSWAASESSGATFLAIGTSDLLQIIPGGDVIRLQKMKRARPQKTLKPSDVIVNQQPDAAPND